MAKRKLPTLFGPKQGSRIEDMSWKGPMPGFGGESSGGLIGHDGKKVAKITPRGGPKTQIVRPSPEIERRLKKLEKDGSSSKPLVTNVGDNTYEWTDEYTWIAYASTISNASSEGLITSQGDAAGFSFGAISDAGIPLGWLGYWTSKSLQQSGDPTDYIWTDLTVSVPASSIALYYTESTGLLPAVGNPTYPGAGITWTLFSGSTPASAFWVATQYTINGTKTPWRIIPVRTKQADLGLIIHAISGRDKPTLNDSTWKADAITAISTFTGNTYSTTNEMGFGTTVVITYDNGKLYGMLKKVGGVATWVTPVDFIDGGVLVGESITVTEIADDAITTPKIIANAITASEINTDAVTADAIIANAVVTDKINANAVTGAKISSTTTITAGAGNNIGVLDGADASGSGGPWRIYAGHATAGSAPFRVSQTGQVTIDSGGDDRLVLSNDKIEVYDGDVLRVKLGNLA